MKAYFECGDYFSELSDYKLQQIKLGETTEEGSMDIMGRYIYISLRMASNMYRSPGERIGKKRRGFERTLFDQARSHCRLLDHAIRWP